MYALVYSSDTDESSTKQLFTVCPKCGRFVKINGHCECETIFFDTFINAIKKLRK